MEVEWPARFLWRRDHSRSRGVLGPVSWTGSLIEGQRDPGGQMYRRNRFYDPQWPARFLWAHRPLVFPRGAGALSWTGSGFP